MRNGPLLRVLASAAIAGVLAVFGFRPADAGYACVTVNSDFHVHIDAADPAVGRDDETISDDGSYYCVGKKNESFTLELNDLTGAQICSIEVGADRRRWVDVEGTARQPTCDATYSHDVTFSRLIAMWVRTRFYFPIETVGDPSDPNDLPAWCIYNYTSYSDNQHTLKLCKEQDY